MKKSIFFIMFLIVIIDFSSAVQIFSDNFESGNLNAWNLSSLGTAANWTSSTTNPYQGTRHAESRPRYTTQPASRMEKVISTFGYENITFSYYRRLIGLDTGDEFQVEWFNGTTWSILEQTGSSSANDASYLYREFNLSSLANDNLNFQIKFECTAGATSEYCLVDNVNLTGILIVSDNINPAVFNLIPEQNSNFNLSQIIEISVNVTDESVISAVKANITFPNGTIQLINLQNTITNKYNNSFAIPSNLMGRYNITFIANDSSNNINSTEKTYFIVNDITPPAISITYPFNTTYNINVSALNYTISDGNLQACWYSLNLGATNNSITCGTNLTGLISAEGSNTWRVYANDSAGNLNFSSVTFVKDTTAPAINFTSPTEISGITINRNNIAVNVTISDTNYANVTINLYNSTGLVNSTFSIQIGYFVNFTNLANGIYYFNATAYDNIGNYNSTETRNVTINYDIIPPQFSNYLEIPANGSSYAQSQNYEFNATITESSISKAGIEFNGINYTNSYIKNNSNMYSFNITNLAAGTYSYYWWANDTNGNYNVSGIRYYSVNKALQSITPLLNGNNANLIITYPQQINASYSGINYTTITIKINDMIIDAARNYSWPAGSYIINYSAPSNQNYSSFQDYLNLTTNKAPQTAILLINETSPIIYGRSINVTCNGELFRNNINITSEKSKAILLGAGAYNYSCRLYESQNYSYGDDNQTFVVDKAVSTIEMYINGTAGNQTSYYGVQTNVSIVWGNSEQTIILYKNEINDSANLNVYQALGIGNYNFTAVSGSTQNYTSLTITRWSHILCQENLQNTSWSDWADEGTCMIDDLQQQVRNRTQYDANYCGYVNTTVYEYQNISCDYCTPNLMNTTKTSWQNQGECRINDTQLQNRSWVEYDENSCGEIGNQTYWEYQEIACDYCSYSIVNSSWSGWNNLICSGNQMNQSRSLTQYDENYGSCYAVTGLASDYYANQTFYEYQLTGPAYMNTSWTSWLNISCLENNFMNQSRNLIQYDSYGCALNQTFFEYRATEFCDYCTTNLMNTTKTSWQNQGECRINDTQLQNRSWVEYDENSCGEIGNQTYWEYQEIACDYCSYSIVNSSWSGWNNLICSGNQMNQSRSLTQYDENYGSCYAVTGLASDYYANQTFYEY